MTASQTHFNTIDEAIKDIANGRMIIVVDDEDRENEGDLVMAAQYATPDAINFMITHGRGLVCLPVTEDILDKMGLQEMVEVNEDHLQTAFTLSIDASKFHGITTGISPAERAKTIQIFINPNSTRADYVSPGHIFPLRAKKMGVLSRAGHTEASVDLARLAGLPGAGVICEIIKDNGDMARVPDLIEFAKKHDLKIITIKDLIRYRVKKERLIQKIETILLPTEYGDFDLTCYLDTLTGQYHLALTKGDVTNQASVLVRVHSECLTGDVFQSLRCDCGPQLHQALKMIAKESCGALLYMRQEGRGIGIANKLRAYKLQEAGADTVEANLKLGFLPDLRDYGVGAQMLLDLGIQSLDLITNNPTKIVGLEGYGIKINKRVPIEVESNPHNAFYLSVKNKKMGHLFKKGRLS